LNLYGSPLASYDPTYDYDSGTTNPDSMTDVVVGDIPENWIRQDIDFGYYARGSIGDTIWADVNSSGGDQSTQGTEPGIPGVVVTLTGPGLPGPITTTTTITGYYLFDDLPLGDYTVTVDTSTLPLGVTPTPTYDPDGSADSVSTTTLNGNNVHDREQDFSYSPILGSIGDTVWYDQNGSGGDQTTQGSEPGIPGVTVMLTDSNGYTQTQVTDGSGNYLFDDLFLGTYTVTVDTSTLPPAYSPVSTHDGTDGGNDSQSVTTIDVNDRHDLDQDFSYMQPAQFGDRVWLEDDGDGLASTGTVTPIAGLTITATDGVNTFTAVTDANGYYSFTVPPGTYDATRKIVALQSVWAKPTGIWTLPSCQSQPRSVIGFGWKMMAMVMPLQA